MSNYLCFRNVPVALSHFTSDEIGYVIYLQFKATVVEVS
jgi:hypothetical protein